jgi:hypothetical protein
MCAMEHFFRHSVEDYRMVDTGLCFSDLENGQFRVYQNLVVL